MYYVIVKDREWYTNVRVHNVYSNFPYKYEAFNADINPGKDSVMFECTTEERAHALASELVATNPKATVVVTRAIMAYKAERPNIVAVSISERGELPV